MVGINVVAIVVDVGGFVVDTIADFTVEEDADILIDGWMIDA